MATYNGNVQSYDQCFTMKKFVHINSKCKCSVMIKKKTQTAVKWEALTTAGYMLAIGEWSNRNKLGPSQSQTPGSHWLSLLLQCLSEAAAPHASCLPPRERCLVKVISTVQCKQQESKCINTPHYLSYCSLSKLSPPTAGLLLSSQWRS